MTRPGWPHDRRDASGAIAAERVGEGQSGASLPPGWDLLRGGVGGSAGPGDGSCSGGRGVLERLGGQVRIPLCDLRLAVPEDLLDLK